MSSSGGPRVLVMAALGASVLAPACSPADPDVVANRQTLRPDAGLPPLPTFPFCRAGNYVGNFNSRSNDGVAQGLSLTGTISFSLVQVQSGELDFKVQSGARLQGMSVQGQPFSADIVSHDASCREGHFRVNLVRGGFTYSETAQPFPFVGIVDGHYYLVRDGADGGGSEGFIGSWQAFAGNVIDGGVPLGHGDWIALWFAPNVN